MGFQSFEYVCYSVAKDQPAVGNHLLKVILVEAESRKISKVLLPPLLHVFCFLLVGQGRVHLHRPVLLVELASLEFYFVGHFVA